VKLQSQTSVLAAHAAKGPWCVAIEFQDLINVRLDADVLGPYRSTFLRFPEDGPLIETVKQ